MALAYRVVYHIQSIPLDMDGVGLHTITHHYALTNFIPSCPPKNDTK